MAACAHRHYRLDTKDKKSQLLAQLTDGLPPPVSQPSCLPNNDLWWGICWRQFPIIRKRFDITPSHATRSFSTTNATISASATPSRAIKPGPSTGAGPSGRASHASQVAAQVGMPSISSKLREASETERWNGTTSIGTHSTINSPASDHMDMTLSPHLIYIPQSNRPVGGGGYCDLFIRFYTPTGSKLAMKRLRPRSQDPEALGIAKRRFMREARIWSYLKHINVLPFHGLVELSGETYLVSPWMEHGDLSKFLIGYLSYLEPSGV
ncbi:hypothetical protein FRB93_003151 [Tulasnella sp. JGI-2019a]|nr:hypothetical protein FRB93_003151 [Tulasnella sp. JGI-2019a]